MNKSPNVVLKRTESEPCSERKRTLVGTLKRNARKSNSNGHLVENDQFAFTAGDSAAILSFMTDMLLSDKGGCEKEIQNFLAAFSNFGIIREELFSVFVQRYHLVAQQAHSGSEGDLQSFSSSSPSGLSSSFDLPLSSPPPLVLKKNDSFTSSNPESPSPSNTGSPHHSSLAPSGVVKGEREALQLILRMWLLQSGALYKRQHPQFFRTVASFLSDVKDPRMNGLKLQLIKNKSESELDSALPFYQAINTAKQTQVIRTGFESSFKLRLFRDFSVQELAEGITFVMFRVYNNIGPSELHDGSWQGKERMIRAPHIHALSVLFNRIAVLCACEILGPNTRDSRLENFMKCLELTKTLKKMNNFEGMSAVASVFSNASISRLKPLWGCLDSKTQKKVKKMEGFFKPQKNYKNYSELIGKSAPPLLPWLAPKLRELRFMYDGNAKKTSEGYLSYSFLQMVGQSVNKYLEFKKTPYNICVPKGKLVHIMETVVNYDCDYIEDCLYDRSRALFES